MRRLLLLIILLYINFLSAQVFDKETIKFSGNTDNRINLVILSEGYQTSELDKFIDDAINFKNAMFSQSPFIEYAKYFNVYAIKVPSNESGADHPGTAFDTFEPAEPIVTADTYFNATFDAFGYHRYLYYGIDYANAASAESKIISVLADNFPSYDQALILVNSTIYGGTGGPFPVASRGSYNGVSANELAIHELGHSLFDLKDEYELPAGYYAEAINMTQEINPSTIKWKNWLNINAVGIYPYGSSGEPSTWNRPHKNCKMRYLGVPFCSVCKEGIIEKIHALVSPIDNYTPVSNTIDDPSFPIGFQLALIEEPNPNRLTTRWTLNTMTIANNVNNVSLTETDLNTGTNDLLAVVHDATDLLRVTNHDTFHVYTVAWTINYSTFGIEDITSKVAQYSIDMHPNPASSILNLKFKSDHTDALIVKIISIDGKILKTASITNTVLNTIDISHFSQGIYMANFYANNTLIASKRIVKN
ncbi:T9SS type A sorting domain-containing protein [Changchengzhania lutea]|uniref:T9SS type A sorting domain-containing protein n=1 Tax=Changchengzhania lutea TaxID=2049305 RepID=UPI00115E3853|nr:M64 family metallopeptidase [Changchengzhania lutea]